MAVVGFDLGYQSSLIGCPRNGGIETLLNEASSRKTSSLVSFGDKQRMLGDNANSAKVTHFKKTAVGLKKLLGRKYKDQDVQDELATLFFKHEELPDGTVGIRAPAFGEDKVFSIPQLLAMLMTQLRTSASAALDGLAVKDCVASCPVFYNDEQRHALLQACQIAGLNCLKTMNETAAVALAYGIYKQDLPAPEEKPRRVIFVDFGHSQIQLSACDFVKGKLTVLATAGNGNIGGRSLTLLLVKHFIEEFKGKYKLDIASNPRAQIRLENECEKLKKTMSTNTIRIPMNIECLMEDRDVQGAFSREEFEALAAPIFDEITKVCNTLVEKLSDLEIPLSDFDAVEIVGGSSRVPKVKDIISEVFKCKISTTLNADEAVARGCALQAAIISPTYKVRDFKLQDKTTYGITITYGEGDDSNAEVFTPNSRTSMSKVINLTKSEDFSVSATYTHPELVLGSQTKIGDYNIVGVTPSYEGDAQKVKVKVKLDDNGCFTIDSASLSNKVKPEEPKAEEPQPMETDEPAKTGEAAAEPNDVPMPDAEPAADAAAAPAEPAKEAEADKPKEPSKKKVKTHKTVSLKIVASKPYVLDDTAINALVEQELDMISRDRSEIEKSNARNTLEEYIYNIREKISTVYIDFIKESDREAFGSKLTKMEDWLYDEGEEQPKSVYVEKLTELEATGNSVVNRFEEAENRPAFEENLRKQIVHFRKFVDEHGSGAENYAHIPAEEVAKVQTAVAETEKWFNEASALQSSMSKFDDPVYTCAALEAKQKELDAKCNPIMNTPKPKAPEEKPPADAAAEGEKKEEPAATATEGDAPKEADPAAAGEEPVQMDLD